MLGERGIVCHHRVCACYNVRVQIIVHYWTYILVAFRALFI